METQQALELFFLHKVHFRLKSMNVMTDTQAEMFLLNNLRYFRTPSNGIPIPFLFHTLSDEWESIFHLRNKTCFPCLR